MNEKTMVKNRIQMKFTPALAVLIQLFLFNVPALAENANELILYELSNFEGESIVFKLRPHENYKVVNNLGDYHQNLKNGVRSFKVGSNVKVWFFREKHLFDGYHRSFPSNEPMRVLNHFNLNDDIEFLVLFKKDLSTHPG